MYNKIIHEFLYITYSVHSNHIILNYIGSGSIQLSRILLQKSGRIVAKP